MEEECDVELIAEGQNVIKQVGPYDFAGYFGTPNRGSSVMRDVRNRESELQGTNRRDTG